MSKIFLFNILIILSFVSNAKLGVFKCVGEGGSISYQEQPCHGNNLTMLEERGITDEHRFEDALILADVKLGQYQVSMIGFNWWKASFKEHSENFAFLKWTDDQGDTPFSLLIDIINPQDIDAIDQTEIRKLTAESLQHALRVSLETKLELRPFKTQGVIGFYQKFTDKNLLGKDSYPPGEYLYTTKGLFKKSGLLFRFTLLSNDHSAQNHQFAFSFLTEGLTVDMIDEATESVIDKNLTAYEQGLALIRVGKLSDSLSYFKQATQEEPDNPAAWVSYCLGLREFNRLQSAFIACDKALSLEPDNYDTQYRVLNLLIKARLFKQALNLSNKLIKQNQSVALINTLNNLGYFALMDNRLDISQKAFDLLVDLEQADNFKLSSDKALLAAVKGDSQEALKLLNGAKISSDFARGHINHIKEKIKAGSPYLVPHEDEESYVSIPKSLYGLGSGQLSSTDVEDWVMQIHPLKGVAEVKFLLPESWEVKIDRTRRDDDHNNLSVKSVYKGQDTTLFSLTVGKVSDEWTLDDMKEDLMDMQKLFMEEPLEALTPLSGGRQGYEYEGSFQKEDVMIRLTMLGEMHGPISVMAHGVELNPIDKSTKPIEHIIESIDLHDSQLNPLNSHSNQKITRHKKLTDEGGINKSENKLPLTDPPDGFSWHKMPKAKAAFLKPNGWYSIEKHEPTYHVYSIMKEDIKSDEQFETGLTLMAFPQLSGWANVSPFTFALDQIQSIEKNADNTDIEQQNISQGPFLSHLIIYTNNPQGLQPIKVHKVFVANEQTGSLYIITFEAPKESWDDAWILGEQILQHHLLDDEF